MPPAWRAAPHPAGGAGRTLTVFAAASLKAPFTALAEEFEAAHPGTTVTLSFAGSSDLATQISQGAPADVFASADAKNMAKLGGAGLVEGSPRDFASNVLTIAVPPGNPASIASFADLARPGVKDGHLRGAGPVRRGHEDARDRKPAPRCSRSVRNRP